MGLSLNKIIQYTMGGFNPLSWFAAGEQGAWYDPSDITTLFQDSAGTIPVTASGQPVGKMLDKSGNNNHAIQATAGARPIYTVSGSLAYLALDGISQNMTASNINFSAINKITCVIALKKNSDAVVQLAYEFGNVLPAGGFNLHAPSPTQPLYRAYANIGAVSSSPTSQSYPAPIINTVSTQFDTTKSYPSQIIVRVNGIVDSTQVAPLTNSQNFISAPLYLFSRSGTVYFQNGNFYGAIFRGAASSNILAAEKYLGANAGLTF